MKTGGVSFLLYKRNKETVTSADDTRYIKVPSAAGVGTALEKTMRAFPKAFRPKGIGNGHECRRHTIYQSAVGSGCGHSPRKKDVRIPEGLPPEGNIHSASFAEDSE